MSDGFVFEDAPGGPGVSSGNGGNWGGSGGSGQSGATSPAAFALLVAVAIGLLIAIILLWWKCRSAGVDVVIGDVVSIGRSLGASVIGVTS